MQVTGPVMWRIKPPKFEGNTTCQGIWMVRFLVKQLQKNVRSAYSSMFQPHGHASSSNALLLVRRSSHGRNTGSANTRRGTPNETSMTRPKAIDILFEKNKGVDTKYCRLLIDVKTPKMKGFIQLFDMSYIFLKSVHDHIAHLLAHPGL